MDNVLIDDRRIHVDFSQSVSKHYAMPFGLAKGGKRDVKLKETQRRDANKYSMVFEGDTGGSQHSKVGQSWISSHGELGFPPTIILPHV